MDMYLFRRYPAEAVTQAVPDYLAISHGGHGVNSFSINYNLVYGPLALFVQVLWGGVYTDNARAVAELDDAFDGIGRVLAAVETGAGRADPTRRLLVAASPFRGIQACAWFEPRPGGLLPPPDERQDPWPSVFDLAVAELEPAGGAPAPSRFSETPMLESLEASSAGIRDRMIQTMARWRTLVPDDDLGSVGTLGPGMALRAVSTVGVLLRRSVAAFFPDVDLGSKPTFGQYLQAIDRYGRGQRMACTGSPRYLVTNSEMRVLNELSRKRSALAHLEERPVWDPKGVGYFKPSDLRALLDLITSALALPIFDELVCREGQPPRASKSDDPEA